MRIRIQIIVVCNMCSNYIIRICIKGIYVIRMCIQIVHVCVDSMYSVYTGTPVHNTESHVGIPITHDVIRLHPRSTHELLDTRRLIRDHQV